MARFVQGASASHQHPSLFHWLALPTARLVVVVVVVVMAVAVEVGAMLPVVRIVAGGNNRF